MPRALIATDKSSRSARSTDALAPPLVRPRAGGHATDADRALALANLDRAIERLEETVEQETAALRGRLPIDLKDYNNRKSHGLLELTRAFRHVEEKGLGEPTRQRLASLRAKLDTNCAVLKLHVEAVREIAAIMADAIRGAESDGTYSASAGRRDVP
ncbi:MAG TPA: hypothetical protein VG966_10565 [Hyphomicrobiaceae bacterium]|jgi:hypothetical protein|nr:hypothetical protein [Hyphomicrobiaceae bacterium]